MSDVAYTLANVQGAAEKKLPPKVFRCFPSNRLLF